MCAPECREREREIVHFCLGLDEREREEYAIYNSGSNNVYENFLLKLIFYLNLNLNFSISQFQHIQSPKYNITILIFIIKK